jgi:tetratricopeptide (TPR) repeat protein
MSNLAISSEQNLQVAYQIWTSPQNPELTGAKELQVEYGIGQPSTPGSAKSVKEVVAANQFDRAGSLVNGKKFDANEQLGNYILSVVVGGSSPDSKGFAKMNLRVVDSSSLPPVPWVVVDPTLREDLDKGVFDRQRGLAYLSQGRVNEGRAFLRRALAANHDDEMARSRLVEAYYSQQDYAAVYALYRDTGVTDNADPGTLLRIATSLRHLGKEADGLSLIEHGADIHSGDPAMFVALADYYTQMGNSAKASTALQKSRELTEHN